MTTGPAACPSQSVTRASQEGIRTKGLIFLDYVFEKQKITGGSVTISGIGGGLAEGTQSVGLAI